MKCCSLSVFYIKPQLETFKQYIAHSCSLSVFYIKPQLSPAVSARITCCSLSVFYIKPQHRRLSSVSNRVVPYQYSTSNRNYGSRPFALVRLFLISILHQTATLSRAMTARTLLFLISILHQTATYALYLIHNQ